MKIQGIFLSFMMLFFISCGSPDKDREKLRVVRYEKIQLANGTRLRIFAGQARSSMESKLSFRVNGVVNYLDVKIGDSVTKGQVIAQLDPNDYALTVQEAEASLLQSKAQLRHAAASYSRIRDLYETHSSSRNQLDASRAESESAAAAVESMQKKLALTRSRLGYTSLTVPANGTIAEVLIEKNESVSRGEPVVILNSNSNLEVHVSVPEILIKEVNKGDQVSVSFDAFPEQYFTGYVSEVGVTSKAGTTFLVTVELLVSPKEVRSGMAGEVQFMFYDPERMNKMFVPAIAVVGRGDSHYLFIVVPENLEIGLIEKREVKVGALTNAGLEILDGVQDGDLVVTAGLHLLSEGQRVKLRN